LALRIRSLREGANLEVNRDGVGFRPLHGRGAASPIRKSNFTQGVVAPASAKTLQVGSV
jgi:hypothetical protein